MKVLVLYHTKTGHTLEAVEATVEGMREAGCTVEIVTAQNFDPSRLKEYDALLIGSPCWGGSVSHGLSRPIKAALEKLSSTSLNALAVAGIAVNGGYGAENTIETIGKIVKQKGCKTFVHGPIAKAGAPLSLWVGPPVASADLVRFKDFGHEFVHMCEGT